MLKKVYFNIFQVILFLCPPIYGLIINLIFFFKKKSTIYFSFFYSLILIYNIPYYDNIMSFENIFLLKNNINNKISFLHTKGWLYHYFFHLNEYNLILYIYIFIMIYLWLNMCIDILKNNKIKNNIYICSLFLLFLIPRNLLDTSRFYLVVILFLKIIYEIEIKNNRKNFILLCILPFIHDFSLIMIFLYILSLFLKLNRKIMYTIIFFVANIIIFNKMVINMIFKYFTMILPAKYIFLLEFYLGNNLWNNLLLESGNLSIVLPWINLNIINIILLIIIMKIPSKKDVIKNMAFFSGMMSLFFFKSLTLNERTSYLFLGLSILLISLKYKDKIINFKLKVILLMTLIFNFLIILFLYSYQIYSSNYPMLQQNHLGKEISYKIFYKPTLNLLDIKHEGFSNKWIQTHIRKQK